MYLVQVESSPDICARCAGGIGSSVTVIKGNSSEEPGRAVLWRNGYYNNLAFGGAVPAAAVLLMRDCCAIGGVPTGDARRLTETAISKYRAEAIARNSGRPLDRV